MTIDWDIVPLPDQAAPAPETMALLAAVMRLPEERFAVLDGALFDDLATELSVHGLAARPLFLEAGGPKAVASGPFLLALREPADIDRLLAFNGARRSPVFWSWPAGEAALYRHLRTLNLVEIPNERRQSPDAPAYETVIFRHWDAIVLGQTLPMFRPGQLARFMSSSQGLCFDAERPDGCRTTTVAPVAIPAETGMVRFSQEQREGIRTERSEASNRLIVSFLLRQWSGQTDRPGADVLLNHVRQARRQALGLGLRAERSVGLWCYLLMATNGAVSRHDPLCTVLRDAGDKAEAMLDQVLADVLSAAGAL